MSSGGGGGRLSSVEAEAEFLQLLDRVKPEDVARFLQWIGDSFTTDERELPSGTDQHVLETDVALREIASTLRQQLPISAVLDSEKNFWPEYGIDSDCRPETTVHVDAFLYDETEIDRMAENGQLNRNYCCACGSHATRPLTFISHSLSVDQLRYVFTVLIPLASLTDGLLVDVGSRLGAVLYAAHLYGNGAVKVIGVELNKELCNIQQKTIEEGEMTERVAVICSDIRDQTELVAKADILVMNNVFCFFLPPQEQVLCWRFMRSNVREGALIVSHPSIEQVTGHLDLGFNISSWLSQQETGALAAKFAGTNEELFEECAKICLYSVQSKPS